MISNNSPPLPTLLSYGPLIIGGEFHPLLGKQLSSAFLSFLVVVVVVVVRRRRRRHNRVLDLGETRQTNSTVKLEQ